MIMNGIRVMLILLDGGSFDALSSLISEGVLPNFTKVMEKGCFGVLHSTIPPISSVAIPSMVTGKNPGKHGMFGFGRFNNGIFEAHTSASIRGETIWDILSGEDKKVVLLNVPLTFPPYKVNGVMISGPPSPRNKVDSFPPEVISALKSEIGEYYVDIRHAKNDYMGLDEKKSVDELFFITKKRAEAVHYLMKNYDWDFFMAVFTSLDRIQHLLFGYFDKESPYFNKEKRETLIKYYEELDDIIGRISSEIDENTILMIVSDHGFEPLYKYVGINDLLVKGGLTKIKNEFQIYNRENIVSFFKKMGINVRRIHVISNKLYVTAQKISPSKIDFKSVKVYSPYAYSICINKKMLVNEDQYDITIKKVTEYFNSVVDEEKGEKIVEKIYRKHELYSGSFLSEAPDILIILKKGYEPRLWTKGIEPLKRNGKKTVKTGTHIGSNAQRGIIIVSGKGIKSMSPIEAKIIDVTPTILHILGVPIPSDMDGIVLKEMFEPGSEFEKAPVKIHEKSLEKRIDTGKLSKDEAEDIKKRLKQLGYLE